MRRLILAIILALCATQAPAQQAMCAPRAEVLAIISDQHGEHRRGLGLSVRGAVTELWGNAETGTWSITHTRPDGVTCIVDYGQNFSARDDLKPASGEPT